MTINVDSSPRPFIMGLAMTSVSGLLSFSRWLLQPAMTTSATLGQPLPLTGSESPCLLIGPASALGAILAGRQTAQRPQSDADCIRAIVQMSSRGATCTLDLARLLSQVRASRPYGAWTELCRSKELPFKQRKAEMLARIGDALGQEDA